MAKSVAIVQSNYIPWKGYFDLINAVDEFIFLDHVQYTKRTFRNRNRIKTAQGPKWLTVPVRVKGRYDQRIDEVEIDAPDWAETHLKTLYHAYGAAPSFDASWPLVEGLYDAPPSMLSEVNRSFVATICETLGITTTLSVSTDYETVEGADECLLVLTEQAGGDHYVSGPTARGRLDESIFDEAGVSVSYFDYDGYPEYDQPHPPFEHAVTILDLLFCVGADAPRYMKTFG